MITHLSYPESDGINFFIDSELCTVQSASFDGVVDMISKGLIRKTRRQECISSHSC